MQWARLGLTYPVAVGRGAGGTAGVVTGSLPTLICCPACDMWEFSPPFRSVQYTSAGWRQAQCGVFYHVTVSRSGCSSQELAVGTAPALPSFVWDETFICLVLPFFYCRGEERGSMRSSVWHTAESSTVLLAVLEDIQISKNLVVFCEKGF